MEPFRIYCLCGQKMRVAPEMHGKPGRCVACRQRLRVPHLHELPEGCTEIRLENHPEFLRPQPTPEKTLLRVEEKSDPAILEPLFSSSNIPEGQVDTEPLDLLDPLRLLCSFDYIVHKKLGEFREGQPEIQVHPDRNALMRYRGLVRKARERLDQTLRNDLDHVGSELMSINEQSARAMLAVRVGEMDYDGYRLAANALRERREVLERRRRNLLGWLSINDPYRAGGLLPVRLEDVPCEEPALPPAEMPEEGTPQLHRTIENLRAAYEALGKAELHLRERNQLRQENRVGGSNLEEVRLERAAARIRAQAAIEFHRSRLKQLAQDVDNDLKAIEAHLDVARKRFQSGASPEAAYHKVEMRLLKAQSDNGQAATLAHRALTARSARELPHPEGTFLQRMVRPDKAGFRTYGVDSYLLWAAGILLAANIMPLAITAQKIAQDSSLRTAAVSMFVLAFCSAGIGAIPNRRTRAILSSVLLSVVVVGGAACVQQWRWAVQPLGEYLRSNPLWFFDTPVLIFTLATLVMGLAALWADFPFKRWCWLPVMFFPMALMVLADGVGALGPCLTMKGHGEIIPAGERSGWYQAAFTVSNEGWYRPVWIGGAYPKEPATAQITAEREEANGDWTQPTPPSSVKADNSKQGATSNPSGALMLSAGDSATLQFVLPPGKYRLHLKARIPAEYGGVQYFTVGTPEEYAPKPEPAVESPTETPPPAQPEAAPEADEGVEVRLGGVLTGDGHDIVLQMEVTYSSGETVSRRLNVGDVIYEPWQAEEYNATTNKLTLSDGNRFLVLATGETLHLPGQAEGESVPQ